MIKEERRMKHRLFLIGLVSVLGLGCAGLLLGLAAQQAQAMPAMLTLQQVPPYKVFLPCILKACLNTYSDDFSDPGSGWDVISETYISMGYLNGEYQMTTQLGWGANSTQDLGVSDYRVEVDAHIVQGSDGGTGILFGATADGYYDFEISEGLFGLWRYDDNSGNWTTLIDWTQSSAVLPYDQVNRLAVDRKGASMTVYVNGQMLGTVNDGTYTGTAVGMEVYSYGHYVDGRFDNFLLSTGSCIMPDKVTSLTNHGSLFGDIWNRTDK
jgi:hypothetical protein